MSTPEHESRRVTQPERIGRLAAWLRRLADQERQTASVLTRVPSGDPTECNTRARLFDEIADTLEAAARPPAEPAQAHPVPKAPMEPDPHPKPWRKLL